jgi:hypothetical protein
MGMKRVDTWGCGDCPFDRKVFVIVGGWHPSDRRLAHTFPKENLHRTGIGDIDKEQIQNHEWPAKWNQKEEQKEVKGYKE